MTAANRQGFSYLEIIMGVLILGVILVPLLGQFYIGFQSTRIADSLSQATFLAEDLMEEIKSKRFDEILFPNGSTSAAAFGPDSGENSANRRTFDDCDDFNGWIGSPPRSLNGTVLSEFTGFSRSVRVEYVTLGSANTWQPSAVTTFYKRVTVTVTGPRIEPVTLHTLFSYRSTS